MKKFHLFFAFVLLFSFFAMHSTVFAQEEPVMYFCNRYNSYDGEIGVRNQFRTGPITVMVRSNYPLRLEDVAVQFERYNFRNGKFEYYKKFYYTIDLVDDVVSFSKNDENDMEFEEPGFYRVFLLDEDGETVATALIEIIR